MHDAGTLTLVALLNEGGSEVQVSQHVVARAVTSRLWTTFFHDSCSSFSSGENGLVTWGAVTDWAEVGQSTHSAILLG